MMPVFGPEPKRTHFIENPLEQSKGVYRRIELKPADDKESDSPSSQNFIKELNLTPDFDQKCEALVRKPSPCGQEPSKLNSVASSLKSDGVGQYTKG